MVIIKAPAKINLHLDIRKRRSDGYHNLWSIFQIVSLFDTIKIRSLKNNGMCRLNGNFGFPDAENIITKAYKSYSAITGITTGIDVDVDKVIPTGAGLGGGSSDGAAIIRALEAFFERPLDDDDLKRCALELGSDVLFFLKASTAVVSGKGEIIESILPRNDYHIVIIYPGFGVETKKAYEWLDYENHFPGKDQRTDNQLVKSYLSDPVPEWKYYNSFTDVLRKRYKVYDTIFEQFKDSGGLYSNITGSGSSVFGIYDDEVKARKALYVFLKSYNVVFCVKPLDKIPLPVLQ
jgi:4-diphosphocytidyl-2-C-methyl-D-erythritol kinase